MTTLKSPATYADAVAALNRYFDAVNVDLFGGELEKPTITIQASVGAYGHITTRRIWHAGDGESKHDTYELNLSADYLNRPVENTVATLVHECCHLYALMHGIQDTSNRGVYHNAKFKEIAEAHKLHIEKDPRYGWTITEPTEDLKQWIAEKQLAGILVSRESESKAGKKAGSNSIKWMCPLCGAIVRSTKQLNIVCGDCETAFIQA